MVLIATILAVFVEWGGICIDGLGVASPATIYDLYEYNSFIFDIYDKYQIYFEVNYFMNLQTVHISKSNDEFYNNRNFTHLIFIFISVNG